jgi:hypothetical protein
MHTPAWSWDRSQVRTIDGHDTCRHRRRREAVVVSVACLKRVLMSLFLHCRPLTGTPVAAQRIWQEHVQKELKYQVVRAAYTRNPATVLLLPEKPCDLRRELVLRRDPRAEEDRKQLMETLRAKDPRAHADVVGRLERAETSPRGKYSYPVTTAHEIGWDLEFARRHAAEANEHTSPHTNADVTAFADKYVSNHGYNPFSRAQFKYLAKPTHAKK